MNIEDKLLIWRFNRGDCSVVRRIYEKYKNDLVALAAALLKEKSAAEDVVHDVFVSFLKLKRFRLTGSLRGFLATCVANAARNVIRASSRHQQSTLDDTPPPASKTSSPDCEAIFGEESRLLSRAIWELPYEQREVVMLHTHAGLKFAQIAESQNVSINTVLGRYRYGLEKLRSKLDGEVQK
ncbi:MAG: RNA polymerase sigma factor [Sedimentisphaerales bacterium]|nr:RNA polymerase sigma factor [Sedimentisphaerales bacterium]